MKIRDGKDHDTSMGGLPQPPARALRTSAPKLSSGRRFSERRPALPHIKPAISAAH